MPPAVDIAVAPEDRALPVAVALEGPSARLVRGGHLRPHLLEPELEEGVRGRERDCLRGESLAPLVPLADDIAELGALVAPEDLVQAEVADQLAVGGAHHGPDHV